jgi:uncharacterized protein YkwD
MLNGAITRVGIAAARASGTRYRVYWSLVLAAPRRAPRLATK